MTTAHKLTIETRQRKRVWCARVTIDGQTYQRVLGTVDTMSRPEARKEMSKLIKLVSPKRIDDVLYSELSDEYFEQIELVHHRRSWLVSMSRRYILPWLGQRLVRAITAADLLNPLRKLEQSAPRTIASTARQVISQVIGYGIATGRAEHNPARDLQYIIRRPQGISRLTITDRAQVSELWRRIQTITDPIVRARLMYQGYTFTRSGECQYAKWSEIDLDGAVWRIDAGRMKMRRDHLIPLAPQVVAMLRDLQCTAWSEWVFPSPYTGNAFSVDVPRRALRMLGYNKNEFCLHGFRAMGQ